MFAFMALLVSFWATDTKLLILLSKSMKERVGIGRPHSFPLVRGDYIYFKHPKFAKKAGYGADTGFAKKLIALPGDEIRVIEGRVQIYSNKRCIYDEAHKKDISPPITAQVIPRDYYFVSGDNIKSMDSRYQMMGLIHKDQIQGKWWGI